MIFAFFERKAVGSNDVAFNKVLFRRPKEPELIVGKFRVKPRLSHLENYCVKEINYVASARDIVPQRLLSRHLPRQ
jgi:hypothetical protein